MPSYEEAKIWGILAAENTANHLSAAEVLARNGFRGQAISLTVLAVEEAVKARAMLGYARSQHRPGFGLDEAMMRKVIRGPHQVRHLIAWFQGGSDEAKALLASGTSDPEAEARLKADFAALDWLMLANTTKNRGLYVDRLGGGSWSTPAAATEAQWEMAMAVATPFVAEAGNQAAQWMADPTRGAADQTESSPP